MTNREFLIDVMTSGYKRHVEKQSKTRNRTLDFVRGMAVFFMVLVHVAGTYSNPGVQRSIFYDVVDFFGGPPAAPVFMFSMGVFFMLSSKTGSFKNAAVRGIKLLVIGILLSFFRDDLLVLASGKVVRADFLNYENLTAVWEVDILQFAGWAYIFMGLIRRCFKKPVWWILIATGIMIVSPMVWGITFNMNSLDWISNYLWGASDEVYFPMFGWLYYPLFGMAFGVMMKAYSNDDMLFDSIIKPGLILLAAGSVISLTDLDFHIGDYFRSGPGSMIWMLGFVLTWIWLSDKLIKKAGDGKIFDVVYYWGKETTSIYIIHWLLITWGTIAIGYENKGYAGTVFLACVTILIAHCFSKVLKIRV